MYWVKDLYHAIRFNAAELRLTGVRLWRSLFGRRPNWPPRRILVIQTEGIGDLIMATPTIDALRRTWPSCEIVLAVSPQRATSSLLAESDLVDRTVELPAHDGPRAVGRRDFWADLAGDPFDLALLCFPFNRRWKRAFVRLVGRLQCHGVALRLGWSDFLNWSRWLRYCDWTPRGAHNVEINLRMAELVGADTPRQPRVVVGVGRGDRAFADEFLRGSGFRAGRPLVGVHPGSLKGASYKRWPTEKHVELARRLHKTFGCIFLVLEGPDDAEAVEQLSSGMGDLPHAVARRTTLGQTAALIERCDLLVNTDSALGHVAAAVRTPTVTIFGPGDPARVRPWGERVRVVRRDLPCSPCIRLWRPVICKYGWRCLAELGVGEVFEAASDLLAEAKRADRE